MTGLSNYAALGTLNHVTGNAQIFGLPQVFAALFNVVGNDSGTGFVEPTSGTATGYSRVQISGTLATTLSSGTGTNVLTFGGGVPAWIIPGMLLYDINAVGVIPNGTTVLSTTSTTVTISNNITGVGVADMDTFVFTVFSPAITGPPCQVTNIAPITFPAPAGVGYGNIIAWGLWDQFNNLLAWDYLGLYQWLPCTISAASPAVITSDGHGFSLSDDFVYTTEYGGTPPTFTAGNLTGVCNVAAPVTVDTFTALNGVTAVNTSTTGDGMVRKVAAVVPTLGQPVTFVGGAPGALIITGT